MTDKELITRLAMLVRDMPLNLIIDGDELLVNPEKYNSAVDLINAWLEENQA